MQGSLAFGAGLAILMLSACTVSEDPADGGFVSGVSGVTSGTYDARIAERQAAVGAEQARQADLQAQLSGLESEYARLRQSLIAQRSQAAAAGTPIPAALDAELQATLARAPSGNSDTERLAAYQKAVADARSLSNRLANF